MIEEPKYTEGICGDGAAILKGGERMTISEIIAELNTRPDSKPYKYVNEDELQDAKGWYTSEFQEAITFAFNAAREREE